MRNLNHDYIGTEHLLLGLLREEEGVASCILMNNLGIIIKDVRRQILDLLRRKSMSAEGTEPDASLWRRIGQRFGG